VFGLHRRERIACPALQESSSSGPFHPLGLKRVVERLLGGPKRHFDTPLAALCRPLARLGLPRAVPGHSSDHFGPRCVARGVYGRFCTRLGTFWVALGEAKQRGCGRGGVLWECGKKHILTLKVMLPCGFWPLLPKRPLCRL
jgi:hypothetical protein